jgi:hypothetical protein
MVWVEFFTSLGFIGFFTIWAFLVGSLAVFGVFEKFRPEPKVVIKNIAVSWVAGYFLVTMSPIGSIIVAVVIRFVATGISSLVVVKKPDIEMPLKISNRGLVLIAAPLAIIVLLGIVSAVFSPPMQLEWYRVNGIKAEKINDQKSIDVAGVEWDDIKNSRIVAQEYALQIPKTLVTETGWRLSSDWDGVYPINNTLYWVMVYEPDKLINYAEDSPAYIIVNAQNPSDRQKIKENIHYSEERGGLSIIYQWINGGVRDVKFKMWLKHPYFDYGDTVFTHDGNGNPAWFAPAKMSFPTIFITTFFTDQVGVATLEDGEVRFYSTEKIRKGNMPEWLGKQILIDEDYTELRLNKWAKFNSWQNFINYYFQHENVFELAQNLYFQYDKDKDRNFGLIQLEPEGAARKSITHFVEIESSTKDFGTVKIFDTRDLKLIGPKRALDDVRGQISLYSDWYALQPIFREIKGGYFYVVPVYSGFQESMVLRAVAVVDAKTEQVKLFKWEDVKSGIVSSTIPPVENQTINATKEICRVVSTELVDGKTRIILECT